MEEVETVVEEEVVEVVLETVVEDLAVVEAVGNQMEL